MERKDGEACHPEPGPSTGPAILLLGIWSEGALQHLLLPDIIIKER